MRRAPIWLAALAIGLGPGPAQAGPLEDLWFGNKLFEVEQQATLRLRRLKGDAEGLAWRAEVLMKEGSFNRAKTDLGNIPATAAIGDLARGDYAWYTGDWDGALVAYEAAARRKPDDLHARWGVASALLHQGKHEPAYAMGVALEADAAKVASEPWGADFLAEVLVIQGAALGGKAEHGNFLDQLFAAPKVRAIFERATQVAPANANAWSALGRYHYFAPGLMGGDARKAAELLEKSKTIDPFFYLNHAYLVKALAKAGEKGKAQVEWTFYHAKFDDLPAAKRDLPELPG